MKHALTPAKMAQLSAAAAAGLALLGCDRAPAQKEKDAQSDATVEPDTAAQVAPLTTKDGKACCMGLNEYKGKGGCAVPESNTCTGKNECKGKNGCNMHCPK